MVQTAKKTPKQVPAPKQSSSSQSSAPRSISQHSEAELAALRSKLEMVSLVSLLATDAIFAVVWIWTFPGLLWILAAFIVGTLLVWLLLVRPQIRSFGRPKN